MDIGRLICMLSFWEGERVPINKIGPSDAVALRAM